MALWLQAKVLVGMCCVPQEKSGRSGVFPEVESTFVQAIWWDLGAPSPSQVFSGSLMKLKVMSFPISKVPPESHTG